MDQIAISGWVFEQSEQEKMHFNSWTEVVFLNSNFIEKHTILSLITLDVDELGIKKELASH